MAAAAAAAIQSRYVADDLGEKTEKQEA